MISTAYRINNKTGLLQRRTLPILCRITNTRRAQPCGCQSEKAARRLFVKLAGATSGRAVKVVTIRARKAPV